MPYAKNMRSATARHFRDAEFLFEGSKFDNAGYHYGFSAECALKGAMERVGITFNEIELDGRNAYYVHFPDLKRIPVRHAGRLSQKIATILTRTQFLDEWNIRMRYSADSAVPQERCKLWREQVREFNNSCMGI
jgi:hypothetical protein